MSVKAVPGLFILFPAWLQHYVVAHNGNRSRISVSFNARLTFPTEPNGDDQFVGAAQPSAGTAPRLTFGVPSQHQQSFLDAGVARDMVVSG